MTGVYTSKIAARQWGLTPEQLAIQPTVYRSDMLAGKTVFISGAGSGMGRATMFLMARLGAAIVICGRDGEKLERAANAVRDLTGCAVARHTLNIRDPDAVSNVVASVFDRFGTVDHLVNSAGGQFPINALDLSPKGWNAVVDTNLNGTFWMMQAFARHWRDREAPGNIVNITMVSDRGIPQSAHSCAARAGVLHLAKSVAVEWAPLGIRVNCLAPGTIETEGLNNYPETHLDRHGKGNPMRRMGSTWEIAEAVAYLCSPAAGFVTGEFLHVDGGMQLLGTNWPLGKPDWFEGM